MTFQAQWSPCRKCSEIVTSARQTTAGRDIACTTCCMCVLQAVGYIPPEHIPQNIFSPAPTTSLQCWLPACQPTVCQWMDVNERINQPTNELTNQQTWQTIIPPGRSNETQMFLNQQKINLQIWNVYSLILHVMIENNWIYVIKCLLLTKCCNGDVRNANISTMGLSVKLGSHYITNCQICLVLYDNNS